MRSLLPEFDDPASAEESMMRGKPGNVGMILASVSARYRVRPPYFANLEARTP